MALRGRGIDLVQLIDCARLSLHGGFFCEACASGLVTSRITRPVRSRRSSNFNSYWDIPVPAREIVQALRDGRADDAVFVLTGARGKRQRSEAAERFGLQDFRGHDLRERPRAAWRAPAYRVS